MGLITEIEVRYGLTINTGNYESERIDLMSRVLVSTDESIEMAFVNQFNYLKDLAKTLTGQNHWLTFLVACSGANMLVRFATVSVYTVGVVSHFIEIY